jgi:hypothetical protein
LYIVLKEHRYLVQIGAETHVLRIQELVDGTVGWGGRFRLQIPAGGGANAQTIYGSTGEEVARLAAETFERAHLKLDC